MSPAEIAASHPDKPAYIMAETGDTVTFAELEATANQGAQLFRSLLLDLASPQHQQLRRRAAATAHSETPAPTVIASTMST